MYYRPESHNSTQGFRHIREGRCLDPQCLLGRGAGHPVVYLLGWFLLLSDTSRHRHMHHTWGKGLGMRMGDSYAHTWMKRFCPSVPPETGSESHHPRPRHARTHCLTLSPLPAQALVLPLPCHHKHSRRAWWERDPHSRHLVKLLHPMSGSKHGCAVLPPPPPTVPSSPSAYSMPSP